MNPVYLAFFAAVDVRWRADAEARFVAVNAPSTFTPKQAAEAAEQQWICDRRIETKNNLAAGCVQGGAQVLAPDGSALPGGTPISPG